jgi:hypothetical protein
MTRPSFVVVIALLVVIPFPLSAQEKSSSAAKGSSTTLKLQVTIVEREGDKKVANLPYVFFVQAGESSSASNSPWTKLRTGARVPVYVGKDAGMQYIDVGTNIDARGVMAEDGRFDISLNLERSWVAGEVEIPIEKPSAGAAEPPAHFKQPIIRQFRTDVSLPMKDGQTSEITQAADPNSGRVLSITVTLSVVK